MTVTTPAGATEPYYDLGSYHRSIDTPSEAAQTWFDRGMVWAYAFNHEEAIRCFDRALELDRDLAIARWGIAYAIGPNYNKAWEAFDPVDLAASLARARMELGLAANGRACAVERGLIGALAARFPTDDPTDADALQAGHTAYADAMSALVQAYPDDVDVAALAADALGPDRVEAVSMPTRYNREGTRSDARLVAERLGISFREVAIEELRLAFEGALPGTTGLAAENLQARIRGVLLMTLSNQHGWLVLTTGNKSETAVGYTTLYGDSAGGFAPIKDVPKTLVFALSRHVNEQAGRELIPVSIIDRPPSAELRDDQRDDQSLPPYEQLDPLIEAYVEDDLSPDEIARRGLATLEVAQRVARLVDLAEYKRRQAPPGIKVHHKAFGRDRRLQITNRFGR